MIRKALSGFYYVHTEDGRVLECRAKGVFRKEGITPLVGDQVEVENGVVSRILPRKNQILRPPAANIDRAVLVVSSAKPQPNTLILDKLIAVCESKGIEPVLVFTKTDLADSGELQEVYRKAGFRVFTSGLGQMDHSELLSELSGRLSVFIGNSGVGKSTLMNELIPELDLAPLTSATSWGGGDTPPVMWSFMSWRAAALWRILPASPRWRSKNTGTSIRTGFRNASGSSGNF